MQPICELYRVAHGSSGFSVRLRFQQRTLAVMVSEVLLHLHDVADDVVRGHVLTEEVE